MRTSPSASSQPRPGPIHRSAWNMDSAKLDLRVTEFYEVGKGTPLPVRTFVLRRAVVPPPYYYAVCYRLTVIVPFMSVCISQW